MHKLFRRTAAATLLALMCALAGCKSAPLKPLPISMHVSAAADANPATAFPVILSESAATKCDVGFECAVRE